MQRPPLAVERAKRPRLRSEGQNARSAKTGKPCPECGAGDNAFGRLLFVPRTVARDRSTIKVGRHILEEISQPMNPRLGIALFAACSLAAAAIAGCGKYGTSATAPAPSPSPSGSLAPDTLYVQDATSRTVRVYKGASQLNGGAFAAATLPTSDNANPDVVYSPALDILWYPNQTTNQVDVWCAASTDNGKAPNNMVPLASQEGTAAYDPNHNLLYVAQNTTNVVTVYKNASSMCSGVPAATTVALNIVDGTLPGTPRPQELLYDPVSDRLFASDAGAVVAEFDGFGAAVVGGATALAANREIGGLFSPDGLAYNAAQDTLWVVELNKKQVDVIKGASTVNGPDAHTRTITGFSSPTGEAYDAVRDILFVYDQLDIFVFPNATTAAGSRDSVPNRRVIFDNSVALSGFGMAVDTTH